MKYLKDLSNLVTQPEKKKHVQRLIHEIRKEMLDLEADHGIQTNVVAVDVEMNQMIETFTDDRLSIVPKLFKCLEKRDNSSAEDTDDTDDEEQGDGAYIVRHLLHQNPRLTRPANTGRPRFQAQALSSAGQR